MKIEQRLWTKDGGWTCRQPLAAGLSPDLVLVFGATGLLEGDLLREVERQYPSAYICGCSTAGEIADEQVFDDSLTTTALAFKHSEVRAAETNVRGPADSFSAAQTLVSALPADGLVHVFVLSDGLKVNGTELVRGLTSKLPAGVGLTGGLSGDGSRFERTLVYCGGSASQGRIMALGFYGDRLRIGYGSMGGWASFGPERKVTKSCGNILYELDDRSALALYKEYLGEHAAGLPASGLLFPISLRGDEGHAGVVRTILAVDEKDQSMTFAGDVPEGKYVRLMWANFDRLIDGASGAAKNAMHRASDPLYKTPDLAVLVSCVGRKLVLTQQIEEEVEAVRDVVGAGATLTGFYSYGEIGPFSATAKCELHNQTMTVTTLTEAA